MNRREFLAAAPLLALASRAAHAQQYPRKPIPAAMTPQAFGEFVRRDIARWAAIAKERGIRLDS